MKVLVTGATGFIGSYVVPELAVRGHRVSVLARESSDVSLLPPDIEIVRGGLQNAEEALDGMEGLVHLAGIGGKVHSLSDAGGGQLRSVNVEGTRSLFEAARRAGVSRAVLVTSMWTMVRPDLASKSTYLTSRIDSEEVVLRLSGGKLETVIACPTFVLGARDRGPNFPGALILSLLRGRLPVVPTGAMDWIAASDTAQMIASALERGEASRRYLLGAEHRTYEELLASVADRAGLRRPLMNVPKSLLRIGGMLGDLALATAWRKAPVPLRFGGNLLSLDGPLDCTPTWRALGEPTARVDDAAQAAIAWFRANGYSG